MKTHLLTLLAAGLAGTTLFAVAAEDTPSLDQPKTVEETAAMLVNEFDADGDQALSLEEFKEAVTAHEERSTEESADSQKADEMGPVAGTKDEAKANLEAVFARSDIDASGSLNQSETVYALEELDPSRVELSTTLP